MDASISGIAGHLEALLPAHLHWLIVYCTRTLRYLVAPINESGGRFHWWALLSALAITGFVFATRRVERKDGGLRALLRYCFPASIYRNSSTLVDLKVGFVNSVLIGGSLRITWRINRAFLAAAISGGLAAWLGPSPITVSWGPVSLVVLALLLSLASDFGYFLFHWAAHKFPPLWAIHKLHHSAEVMSPLTTARVHPFEAVIMGPFMAVTTGFVAGPLFYIYGGDADVLTILGVDMMAMAFYTIGFALHHSHVWVYFGPVIGRIIVSPAQHQIHHSSLPHHLDKNFAEHWAIWDTLFGTLYLPHGRETLKLGLAGYDKQPHSGLLTAYCSPVVEAAVASVSGVRRWVLRNPH